MAPEQINLRKRFFLAVSLACLMAVFMPLFAEDTSAVAVPFPPGTKEFVEWCETAPNWAYILAGCFIVR
jgi:hypothetical protein